MDPILTPIVLSSGLKLVLAGAATGMAREFGKTSGRFLIDQFQDNSHYAQEMLSYWKHQDAKQEAHNQRMLELLRDWQTSQIDLKLTEIEQRWDKDTWFSKLSRKETKRILRQCQRQYRFLVLASPPNITRSSDVPESLRENLPLELPDKLGRFLRQHYPLKDEMAPVEFYGDYFREPISDIDVRRLQGVLRPVPTAVLYSSITDYEVNFHVGMWNTAEDDPVLVVLPAWNWEDTFNAVVGKAKNEIKALRIIRQTIAVVHQLLAGFVIDWHYLHINPMHQPRLFTLMQVFENEGLPQGLEAHLDVLRDYQQKQRQIYDAEVAQRKKLPPPQDIHGWSADKVQALQQRVAHALGLSLPFRDRLANGSEGPEMVVIPAGSFLMGSPGKEKNHGSDEQQHPVTIEKPFAIGRYAVTFKEYDRFCQASQSEKPDDEGWGRGKRPVINVSWHDAMAYAQWLSEQTGQQYRLPTEAEWEYACRAGTITPFNFGKTITPEQVNYDGDYPYVSGQEKGWYREQTVPVGSLPPNAWGLYDMHGNVHEWTCSKWAGDYDGAEKRCAKSEDTGSSQVVRGGSWYSYAGSCRSAYRYRGDPAARGTNLGFRLARQ